MDDTRLNDLEAIFLAFSDQTRLRLVALMADGEVSVSFLAEQTGESQPKISRHLAYLRDCGVVTTRRDGKWIYYSLREFDDPRITIVIDSVIQALGSVSTERTIVTYRVTTEDKYVESPPKADREEAGELDVFLL